MEGGPPSFVPGFPCQVLLRILPASDVPCYRAVTFCGLRSSKFTQVVLYVMQSYNPGSTRVLPVWAFPISLATTLGISVDFFS